MKITIVLLCLVGAVFTNPILFKATMEPREFESNVTQSSSASQSSDQSNTSELQSSEENTSEDTSEDQTSESESESESESLESNSEDESSEESQSQSLENKTVSHEMGVTRDNSLGSEENVRKGWIRMFAKVVQIKSPEDTSRSDVKGQQTTAAATVSQGDTKVRSDEDGSLVDIISRMVDAQSATGHNKSCEIIEVGDTSNLAKINTDSSESSDTSEGDTSNLAKTNTDSSESSDTSEGDTNNLAKANTDSSESSETSETSDSSESSESTESDDSDSDQKQQLNPKDCQRGVDIDADCDSEEYFFQDIGDDAHYPVDNLMMPEEVHELHLRR